MNIDNPLCRRAAKVVIGLAVGVGTTVGLAACGSSASKTTVTNVPAASTPSSNPSATSPPTTNSRPNPTTAAGGGVSY